MAMWTDSGLSSRTRLDFSWILENLVRARQLIATLLTAYGYRG